MENQQKAEGSINSQDNNSSISSPLPASQKTKGNAIIIGGVIFVCFLVFGLGGYLLGKQSSIPKPVTQQQLTPPEQPASLSRAYEPTTTENIDTQPDTNCTSTFTSKYLKLSFSYDSCAWKLRENLITPESGVYSTIIATNTSNHKLTIKANTIGMGGGYPSCYLVDDVNQLENEVVRFHMSNNPMGQTPKYYYYLNAKNDYAIKDTTGKHGNEKFKEYFTFLSSDAYPNTNMCWRGDGINLVEVLQPKAGQKELYELNKDIILSIEEEYITNVDFLKAADALAVSIFSSLPQ